jgi:hypothetical protein
VPSTTPRQDARAAFKAILDAANLGVPVFDRMPYEGAEQRSVVLTLISGVSRPSALGNQITPTQQALEEHHRIQVDCYHDDQTQAGMLAGKVEQVIMDSADTLASTYDIHDVRKLQDMDVAPPEPTLRECRVLLDFGFYTHRTIPS